jgi:acyl carrier protein
MNLNFRLRNVFAAVFGVEPTVLNDADSPETIEGWDSVKHIQLVLALESEFGMQFEPDEIAELIKFGVIRELLEARTGMEVSSL